MDIFNKKYIKTNLEVSSKHDALKKISNFAKELEIISSVTDVTNALKSREEESSTGFENGFAIPHARTKSILKPAILFIKFKKAIDWNSLDKQLTSCAFVLLIPEEVSAVHLDFLSKISTALMDKNFVNKIKETNSKDLIYEEINKYFTAEDSPRNNDLKNDSSIGGNSQKRIIALTACPVGVAHTYLAADKLKEAGKLKNIWIKVETHGSVGIKNQANKEEIEKADAIIVASDIGLDLSRFNNKVLIQTPIKEAIHNPNELIDKALNSKSIYKSDELKANNSQKEFNKDEKKKMSVMKHILSGISYMIPFVILGGICIALSAGLGKAIYGQDYSAPQGDFFYYLNEIGSVAFTLMIGVLGAYIAYSIAGRATLAPAFIVSIVGNTPNAIYTFAGIQNDGVGMGFLGSILFGLLIGYTVKWINTWKIPKSISSIMPIFVIPLGVGLFYGLIAIFVIGAPVAFVMGQFINALKSIFVSGNSSNAVSKDISLGVSIAIGILIGAMAGFDMGGPINKVAFLTCTALISSKVTEPMGMMAAAIPVAPLGMGLCTMIFRNKFSKEEKTMGISAFIMGFIGISEGAIPFAISDPKRAIACNVVGSAITGGIAGALGITCAAAHGGPIVGILGAVSSNEFGLAGGIGLFFVTIIIGMLITCFLYGIIRKTDKNNNQENFKDVFKIFKRSKNVNKVNLYKQEKLFKNQKVLINKTRGNLCLNL